jgi:hypothetical protein
LSRPILSLLRAGTRLRLTATLLCLLACTVQSFVAQTHVHARGAQPGTAAAYVADAGSAGDESNKHQGGNDTTSCPLCQIVLHGGAAPAPAFVVGLAPQASTSVEPADRVPAGTTVSVSYSWQSRAPPQLIPHHV